MDAKCLGRIQRKQIRKQKKKQNLTRTKIKKPTLSLDIQYVEPRTENQSKFMKSFEKNDVVVCTGYPGTGKTFLALYMALTELEINREYEKVIIVRSAVSSRDIGFQPGKTAEKMAEYEAPYSSNINKLYGRGDAYQIVKQKGYIEFASTSFLRGTTFDNSIVILDEFQNLSFQELTTFVTRFGENCKMIILGDTGQDDLTSERFKEHSGAKELLTIFNKMKGIGRVTMDTEDIVRSGFVKDFIIAQYGEPDKQIEMSLDQYKLI